MAVRCFFCIAFLSLFVVACAPAAPQRPAPGDVVRDYLSAVERGDADAAYELLAPPLRAEMDPEAFRAYFQRFRPELHQQAEALYEATRSAPEIHAVVRVPEGAVTVREHRDGWRLTEPLWPMDPQGPRAALLAFAGRLHAASVPEPGEAEDLTVPLEGGGEVVLRRGDKGWVVHEVRP